MTDNTMASSDSIGAQAMSTEPKVRRIGTEDLRWALRAGWQDFRAMRGDIIFVAVLYPLIGLVTAAITVGGALLPLLFPLVAGLSILGPVVAAGFYELARRRERGEEAGWSHFLDPLRRDRRGGVVAITSLLLCVFLAWLLAAWLIYQVTLGPLEPVGAAAFATDLLTTRQGWTLIVAGNAAGLVIAAITLASTIVSVPMVVDTPVEPAVAVRTSLRAAARNPGTMAAWGAIVAAVLLIGAIPLFIGLAVALPVLGYATWHLYTRLVER